MGQNWTIFSLDKHENFVIYNSWSEIDDFLFTMFAGSALKTLIRWPASSTFMIEWVENEILFKLRLESSEADRNTSQSLDLNQSLTLNKLPVEIIHIILDYNDDLEDTISFSLTCRHFWHVGKHHVIRIRDGLIAKSTWAGSRIICVGDAQEDNDWPSSIPEEEYKSYGDKYKWPDRNGDNLPLPDNYYGRSYKVNPMEKIVIGYLCKVYLKGTTFVLRNLSKKLYVLQDQFEKIFEGYDITPQSKIRITLGHVALAYICWSPHPTTLNYRGPINRGTWAGDRLEIVPIIQHTQELEEEEEETAVGKIESLAKENGTLEQESSPDNPTRNKGIWKDVTEESQKLIADIWGAEYGVNWREYVVKLNDNAKLDYKYNCE